MRNYVVGFLGLDFAHVKPEYADESAQTGGWVQVGILDIDRYYVPGIRFHNDGSAWYHGEMVFTRDEIIAAVAAHILKYGKLKFELPECLREP